MKIKGQRRKNDVESDDDEPNFDFSDEEGHFTKHQKLLLDRHRKNARKEASESEEELFGMENSDEDNMDNDIVDEENDIPNIRAWGQRKKNYYDADYVDQDFGGIGAQEEETVEMEEAEAMSIQNRLAEHLKDSDFTLDIFTDLSKKSTERRDTEDIKVTEQIKKDLTTLSKRQKLELFEKESPEFVGLMDQFKESLEKLNKFLEPMRSLITNGSIPQCPASDCIKVYYELILNYCVNLGFYLLLKARHVSIQAHPVIGRLVQYRKLINELEQNLPEKMQDQIETILQAAEDQQTKITREKLRELFIEYPADVEIEDNTKKILKVQEEISNDEESAKETLFAVNSTEEEADLGKRGITYQIAKNKGLTPYRKKELRNPRVKHRMKFRKANIRRKGQIREVRTEVKKYGGEISGIKTTVSKSIKFK